MQKLTLKVSIVLGWLALASLILLPRTPAKVQADPGVGTTFVVNSVASANDTLPGDGVCDTGATIGGAPECTLEAAVQEANNNLDTNRDVINFAIPSDQAVSGFYRILPNAFINITQPVEINGYS